MKFIAQRCSNVNRGAGDEPKRKRGKTDCAVGKHTYMEDLDSIIAHQSSSSFDRNYKKMLSELSKSNPNSDILCDLLEQTYSFRRKCILTGELTVFGVFEKYILLRKPKHVR